MKLIKKEIFHDHDGRPPYMIRWTLFSCKRFQLFIHKFLREDDDCLHDHPWNFISLILWGGYTEHIAHHDDLYANKKGWKPRMIIDKLSEGSHSIHMKAVVKSWYKFFTTGTILYRKATYAHRIEVKKPCYSFVITFKKIRTWGFITASGWVEWRKYITGGRKCT